MEWRKNLTGLMLPIAALLAAVPVAHAQDEPAPSYPSRVIRIIVPYAAGGTDLLARTWAEVLSKDLGQSVIVENRTGGAGVIGTRNAARPSARMRGRSSEGSAWRDLAVTRAER